MMIEGEEGKNIVEPAMKKFRSSLPSADAGSNSERTPSPARQSSSPARQSPSAPNPSNSISEKPAYPGGEDPFKRLVFLASKISDQEVSRREALGSLIQRRGEIDERLKELKNADLTVPECHDNVAHFTALMQLVNKSLDDSQRLAKRRAQVQASITQLEQSAFTSEKVASLVQAMEAIIESTTK